MGTTKGGRGGGFSMDFGNQGRSGGYGNQSRNNNYGNKGRNDGYNNNYGNRQTAPVTAMVLPSNYLDEAEDLMKDNFRQITSTKLRRIYSMVTEVYNDEKLRSGDKLAASNVTAISMMRVRIAYECGRDYKVMSFVRNVKILEYLKGIGSNRQSFMKFVQYMEALVAYHKFYGGRD